jgi:hypothetical protein
MDRGSNPKLNERISEPIDLSDLIEAQQLKTAESLSESIEKYQDRMVACLVEPGGGWERATCYSKTLVTKLGKLRIRVAKLSSETNPAVRSGPTYSTNCKSEERSTPWMSG